MKDMETRGSHPTNFAFITNSARKKQGESRRDQLICSKCTSEDKGCSTADAVRLCRVLLYVWGTHCMVAGQTAYSGFTLESHPETAISWRELPGPSFCPWLGAIYIHWLVTEGVQLKRQLILNLSIFLWDSILKLRFMEMHLFLQQICIKHKPCIWTIPRIWYTSVN